MAKRLGAYPSTAETTGDFTTAELLVIFLFVFISCYYHSSPVPLVWIYIIIYHKMTRNILKVKRTMFINLLEIKQRNNA